MIWTNRRRWNKIRVYVVPTVLIFFALGWLILDGRRFRSSQLSKYEVPSDHSARSMLEFMRKMDGSLQYSEGYFDSSNAVPISLSIREAYAFLQSDQQNLTESEVHEAEFYHIHHTAVAILNGVVQPDNSSIELLTKSAKKFLTSAKIFSSREKQVSSFVVHVLESCGRMEEARDFGIWTIEQISVRAEFTSDAAQATSRKLEKIVNRLGMINETLQLQSLTLEDQPFDLSSLRGKVVLVEFWGTHCKPCIADFPAMKRIYASYQDRGFEIVAISLHAAPARIKSFVAEHNLPWIQLCEDKTAGSECNQALMDRFGIEAVPTTMLIDKEGRVAAMGVRPLAGDKERDLQVWLDRSLVAFKTE